MWVDKMSYLVWLHYQDQLAYFMKEKITWFLAREDAGLNNQKPGMIRSITAER